MHLLQLIQQAAQWIVGYLQTLLPSIVNGLHYLAVILFREYLQLVWSLISALPIPNSLLFPSLPDPGPLGSALVALGVPQAIGILSAAFTIKLGMKLIPFVML